MNGAAMPVVGRLCPAFRVVDVADIARADILADRELVATEVLENDADALPQRLDIPVLQIESVEQNAPLGRVVESGQQLDQRRLARAVLADQREALPGADLQADVAQEPAGARRVA